MNSTLPLYNGPLALLTDLYELTMAYGYWKNGRAETEAVFNLSFREQPFHGGFTVTAGLGLIVDYLEQFHFGSAELEMLARLRGTDGNLLFPESFLSYLENVKWSWDVDAIAEGRVVFPFEPLLRVTGPLLQVQLLESFVLNSINFSSLISTKAARICLAAQGDPVIDFGLRQAQGIDGALTASRAAYIGGCEGTSNVLAGLIFAIPIRGTHAHSWVMSFESERESFEAYARAFPANAIFLVDTYNSLSGVAQAIKIGQSLRTQGSQLGGIRLDSGDLAYLSIEARKLLDRAGFPDAQIIGSSELDEYLIQSLKQQGAKISIWGVGTRLIVGHDTGALGATYKLGAIRKDDGTWRHVLKLSEQIGKIPVPGKLSVERFEKDGLFLGDRLIDLLSSNQDKYRLVSPEQSRQQKTVPAGANSEELLVPVFRNGKLVYKQDIGLSACRRRLKDDLAKLHPTIKRFENPHLYPVGLAPELQQLRDKMITEKKEQLP